MALVEQAVERGMLICVPIERFSPQLEPLRDNPRLAATEAVMVENINTERQSLGLETIDPLDHCWTRTEEP